MQNYSGLNDSKKRSESMAKMKAKYLLPIPYEKKERSVLKKIKKSIKRRLSPQKKHYLCIQTDNTFMKKISRDAFDIRSLSYYQSQGGVYNDIITVLTKMRRDSKFRGMPAIPKILNEACYQLELSKEYKRTENRITYLSELDKLTTSIIAVIAVATDFNYYETNFVLSNILEEDNIYYPKFKNIIVSYQNQKRVSIQPIGGQDNEQSLRDELKAKESQLADAYETINSQKQTIEALKSRKESKVDKSLTLTFILSYMEKQRQYKLVDQMFVFLLESVSQLCTQEEWNQICALKQKMLDDGVTNITNNNNIQNSNVFPGLVENPNFPIGTTPEEIIMKAFDEYFKKQNNG